MIFGTRDLGYFQAIPIDEHSIMHDQCIPKLMGHVGIHLSIPSQRLGAGMSSIFSGRTRVHIGTFCVRRSQGSTVEMLLFAWYR